MTKTWTTLFKAFGVLFIKTHAHDRKKYPDKCISGIPCPTMLYGSKTYRLLSLEAKHYHPKQHLSQVSVPKT
jgi:hypothetical protein